MPKRPPAYPAPLDAAYRAALTDVLAQWDARREWISPDEHLQANFKSIAEGMLKPGGGIQIPFASWKLGLSGFPFLRSCGWVHFPRHESGRTLATIPLAVLQYLAGSGPCPPQVKQACDTLYRPRQNGKQPGSGGATPG